MIWGHDVLVCKYVLFYLINIGVSDLKVKGGLTKRGSPLLVLIVFCKYLWSAAVAQAKFGSISRVLL